MKNSNKAKRFWTLNRRHAGGFTLVELIVVIAILAILAGVAVPAYSGYVTRANKQADINLANEVGHALELAFYNRELPNGGMVVLTKDGVDTTNLKPEVKAAIEATFGSVTSVPGLKYNGWNGDYSGGSYAGKETALLGTVEGLTEKLAEFLTTNKDSSVLGGRFGNYLKNELGFTDADLADAGKVADAAVLYVAYTTENLSSDQQKALAAVGNHEDSQSNPMSLFQHVLDDVYPGYGDENPQNVFAATATTYAILAGYYSYRGLDMPDMTYSVTSGSASDMMAMLTATFGTHFADAANREAWKEYLQKQSTKDAGAFMDVMGTVDGSKGLITDRLGAAYDEDANTGCYSNAEIETLFDSYGKGNILVVLDIISGVPQVDLIPDMK